VKTALYLCHKNNSFLFQVLPDIFPQGFLTNIEAELWAKFLEEQKNLMKER